MDKLIGSTVQNTHGAQFRVTDVGWVSAFFSPVLCVQLVELSEVPGHWPCCVPVESFLVQFITCPVQAQAAG